MVTSPFILAQPGVMAEEIAPWSEQGETWRRLRVTFPETIATHSREQIFYIDTDGLIRRHDGHSANALASALSSPTGKGPS